jgi:nudix-type nucleoside diphosphatase (YffH/AdpP family)
MTQQIIDVSVAYKGWLTVLRAELSSNAGAKIVREIVERGGAAAVLPYDAERGTALLVRVPRAPALLARGELELLEAIAGLIEGEGAEACARREAMEEAGVRLGALEPVAQAYSSPGFTTERISLFLAPYRQADRVGPGGGVPDEHEDIMVVETDLPTLWAEVERGAVEDMKTLALIQALRIRQPELFGG